MQDLVAQSIALVLLELGDLLEGGGILGDEGASLEELDVGGEVGVTGKLGHVVEEGFTWDAGKRILNSAEEKRMDKLKCVGFSGGWWGLRNLPGGDVLVKTDGLLTTALGFIS